MPESGFDRLYRSAVTLLETLRFPYLVVGGMATGVLGEPRLTHDVDVIVELAAARIDRFLEGAQKAGFRFDETEARAEIDRRGTFRLLSGNAWVDVIIASTELEKSAFRRAKRVKVLGVEAAFPTPEDFILFKLIPGRPKDLLDVESVVARHRNELDRPYLERWAQSISDEMEDLRVYNAFKRLLGPK